MLCSGLGGIPCCGPYRNKWNMEMEPHGPEADVRPRSYELASHQVDEARERPRVMNPLEHSYSVCVCVHVYVQYG